MAAEAQKTLPQEAARAFDARDLITFESLFTPNSVLHDPNEPSRPKGGWKE